MKNKLSIKLVLLLGSLFIISIHINGCSAPDKNSEVVIALDHDIQTLDPTILTDPSTSHIVWQIYEGLVGIDDQGDPVPLIAKSWHHDNKYINWTFELRPNVYFHKSPIFDSSDSTRTVNAYDVKYSLTQYTGGPVGSIFSGLVEGFDKYLSGKADDVSGFTVVDSLTFRITLKEPNSSFIYYLTSPYFCIMPTDLTKYDNGKNDKKLIIGTGPYQFENRTDVSVRLKRNPLYWRETEGNVKQITFRVEKNQQIKLSRFQNVQYDLVQLPISLAPQYIGGQTEGYSVVVDTTYNIHFMVVDLNQIEDVYLRRAIAFSINKKLIVEKLLHGYGNVANSPVNPGMRDYYPPNRINYNLRKAKRALKKSNYNGRSIKLMVSNAGISELVGQTIQQMLEKTSINIKIDKVNFNTLISKAFSNKRPPMFIFYYEWIYSAPELIAQVYNSEKIPSLNLSAYRSNRVDSLFSILDAAKQRKRINELVYKIEYIAQKEVPSVWLYHQYNIYLLNEDLENFNVNPHNDWKLENLRWSNN